MRDRLLTTETTILKCLNLRQNSARIAPMDGGPTRPCPMIRRFGLRWPRTRGNRGCDGMVKTVPNPVSMMRSSSSTVPRRLRGMLSLDDFPAKKIVLAHIRKAMKLNEDGVKMPAARKAASKLPPEMPEDLVAALNKDNAAKATFDAFPPSCRREYIEWIVEAKREETRAKRLAQTVEWLAEGKRRNWKYENC